MRRRRGGGGGGGGGGEREGGGKGERSVGGGEGRVWRRRGRPRRKRMTITRRSYKKVIFRMTLLPQELFKWGIQF